MLRPALAVVSLCLVPEAPAFFAAFARASSRWLPRVIVPFLIRLGCFASVRCDATIQFGRVQHNVSTFQCGVVVVKIALVNVMTIVDGRGVFL